MTKLLQGSVTRFKAIIVLFTWTAAVLTKTLIDSLWHAFRSEKGLGLLADNTVMIIIEALSPVLIVFVLSIIVVLIFTDKQKSLPQIFMAIAVAGTPRALSSVLDVISAVITRSAHILSHVSGFLYMLWIVMLYVGLKELFQDDDKTFLRKFVKIQAVYYLAKFILNFFRVYI